MCGKNQVHNYNLGEFLKTVKKYSLMNNEEKNLLSVDIITLLGYLIS